MVKDRTISHIVAASENNIIGRAGELPWRLPDDFRHFKNTTWAMPVIMGRKTYVNLPGRIKIVITSNRDWQGEDTTPAQSLDDALDKACDADTKEIFIIGGGEIFRQSMDVADRIYMTRVHVVVEGDTKYPEINPDVWKKVSSREHPADEKHQYAFTFEVWERKQL